jgi:hypothetical protein
MGYEGVVFGWRRKGGTGNVNWGWIGGWWGREGGACTSQNDGCVVGACSPSHERILSAGGFDWAVSLLFDFFQLEL